MVGKQVTCSSCSRVMRSDNLKRHVKICQQSKCYTPFARKDQASERCERKRKISIDKSEEVEEKDDANEIPTFDGDEFSGKKPKSRETLNRMMEMLKIPEHRWEKIATDMLQEDRKRDYYRCMLISSPAFAE